MAKDGKLLRLRISRLRKEGEGLFCLPLGFRDALLDIGERLTWARTWIDENEETAVLSDEDWQLIETGLWRLTDMCEIIINNIIEVPPAPVTINNSTTCGCGDYSLTFPTPTTPDGTPWPCVPLNPEDPLGETVPTWDDETETPPSGWPDYPTFDESRCRSANWFVDSFLIMVRESDLIERQMSWGAVLVDIALVFIKALPGPVGEWAGTIAVIRILTRVLGILANAVGALEELNDYLQLAADKIEENKFQLVCAAYRMTSVEYLRDFFITFFGGYISPELVAAGASETMVNWTRQIVTPFADELAVRVHDFVANQHIPEEYVGSVDCAMCGETAPPGFVYIPAELVDVTAVPGTGVSAETGAVVDAQSSTISFEANGPGRTARLDHEFQTRLALIGSEQWVGFGYTASVLLNALPSKFGAGHPTDTANEFIGRDLTPDQAQEIGVQLALTEVGYPTEYQNYRVIHMDELSFADNRVKIGLTAESATAGPVTAGWSGFYWIKKLAI